MSYLVLARKHRPQNFESLIGQEHIAEIISKSINSDRIGHAFLFCGPRGIGKTSCARILAKCLNCEKAPTLTPCGECSACKEISQGKSFDVLEIDGASNRGIDEIRMLRDNVKFAPSYGSYKIYIVDEVHMLTTEAFNALLKTLEEPPEHVKFIFATTEPNKVPSTIISRCHRFDFKRIPLKVIVEHLADLCKKEGFEVESDALYAIAKASQGSLRDALSILDQLSALSDRNIESKDVFSMLGLVEIDLLFQCTDALGEKNCVKALELLEQIIDKGKDIKQLVKDLTEHFRNLMIIKVGGKSLGRLVDYPIAIKEQLLHQTERFSLSEILEAIEILVNVQETSRITESLRMPLEVAFAKLTYTAEGSTAPQQTVRPQAQPARPALAAKSPPKASVSQPLPKPEIVREDKVELKSPPSGGAVTIEKIKKNWDAVTFQVSKEKMSVATFLQEGIPVAFKNGTLSIGFPAHCLFQKESLESQDNTKLIEGIISKKFGQAITIKLILDDNVQPKEEEPIVKQALDAFGGKVINRWHNETEG